MGYLTFWIAVVAAACRGFDSPVNAFDLRLERTAIFEDLAEFAVAAAVGFVKLNSKLSSFVILFEARGFVGPQIAVQLVVAAEPLVVSGGGHLVGEIVDCGTVGSKFLLSSNFCFFFFGVIVGGQM